MSNQTSSTCPLWSSAPPNRNTLIGHSPVNGKPWSDFYPMVPPMLSSPVMMTIITTISMTMTMTSPERISNPKLRRPHDPPVRGRRRSPRSTAPSVHLERGLSLLDSQAPSTSHPRFDPPFAQNSNDCWFRQWFRSCKHPGVPTSTHTCISQEGASPQVSKF